jgi:hypothetical protein
MRVPLAVLVAIGCGGGPSRPPTSPARDDDSPAEDGRDGEPCTFNEECGPAGAVPAPPFGFKSPNHFECRGIAIVWLQYWCETGVCCSSITVQEFCPGDQSCILDDAGDTRCRGEPDGTCQDDFDCRRNPQLLTCGLDNHFQQTWVYTSMGRCLNGQCIPAFIEDCNPGVCIDAGSGIAYCSGGS